MKTFRLAFAVFLAAALLNPPPASASVGLIAQGLAKTLYAVVQLPASIISGSTQSFPFGIIGGTIAGSMKAVAGTVLGAADMARGAAPYAKYAALAL